MGRSERPDVAEFIGQAHMFMDLPTDRSCMITRNLKLQDGAEGKLNKRTVQGAITLQYEWTPLAASTFAAASDSDVDKLNGQMPPGLRGKLKVTVIQADNVMNLCYSSGKRVGSNPYCRVFCYPHSPSDGRTVCPSAWRMPLQIG